jgi:hypothetical protein
MERCIDLRRGTARRSPMPILGRLRPCRELSSH